MLPRRLRGEARLVTLVDLISGPSHADQSCEILFTLFGTKFIKKSVEFLLLTELKLIIC